MAQHTILLLQRSRMPSSRTFTDHENLTEAIESVITLYEGELKEQNPNAQRVTYEIGDLHAFVDNLEELCALVFSPQTKSYIPHDKEWLKEKTLVYLKKAAEMA